ncbi:hypothetical protein FSW04_15505 [Baekduia soli]|uniref:Uncharacterized protein n=1 Tax=Baekduia soli TaxID=496014 RepID=A0A5B8U763_9ACTN|nr:hypothetical protein [Baekduia soli]QEC48840.1 hypothetical protein FSW04_15505 [Baekduia soli]
MAALLGPARRLVVVGVARPGTPLDLVVSAAGAALHRRHRPTKGSGSTPRRSPSPPTHGAMRRLAGSVLPGVGHRRHVLWGYSLVWTRPPATAPVRPPA